MTEQAEKPAPVFRVLIRKDQGTAQERFHSTDQKSAVSYYNGTIPTGGFAKILVIDEGGKQRVVETTRYVAATDGGDAIPVKSKGEAYEGFDWTSTPKGAKLEDASEVRGDPLEHSAKRRRELLGLPADDQG